MSEKSDLYRRSSTAITSSDACCTCATLFSDLPLDYDDKTEKPVEAARLLDCCGRKICWKCLKHNPRFRSYCPYCQHIAVMPSDSRVDGHEPARLPSRLTAPLKETSGNDLQSTRDPEKPEEAAEDVLHFVNPVHDSISSLSLRYGVPAAALRQTNGIFTDHLLPARRTILIPGEYYKDGISLSPQPIEGEEEEARKSKIRRWMVTCKVPEYDLAILYLDQTNYDLDAAVEAYMEDEKWERENPLAKNGSKGKDKLDYGKRRRIGMGGGLTGQLS